MTPTQEAAMRQALEALDACSWEQVYATRGALRAALAEPVQEPVAWLTPRTVDSYMRPDLGYETCSKTDYAAFPVYTAPPQCLNGLNSQSRAAIRQAITALQISQPMPYPDMGHYSAVYAGISHKAAIEALQRLIGEPLDSHLET